MRAASLAILEKIGVETGGSNVQFAVNPENGRMIVIEMNPRVSRSSALASKATGFPIAKVAAKLAVGYTLDEIVNDITKATPGVLRALHRLLRGQGAALRVREVPGRRRHAVHAHEGRRARSWPSAARSRRRSGKAMRSLENGRAGLGADGKDVEEPAGRRSCSSDLVARPTAERVVLPAPRRCAAAGRVEQRMRELTGIDPFFISRMADIVRVRGEPARRARSTSSMPTAFRLLKRMGLSDAQIAHLHRRDELGPCARAASCSGVKPAFKTVDTCAAEFPSTTAYHYKTYDADETEVAPKTRTTRHDPRRGPEPHRPGHRVRLLLRARGLRARTRPGFETIMVNCNPETVSTDYDTSDKLYFEPLTFEDVMDIVRRGAARRRGRHSSAARRRSSSRNALAEAGVPIMGT